MLSPLDIKRMNKRTKILKVMSYYGIDVEKDGCSERLRACCPFHTEKTPSFKVYINTNSWFSFCCQLGGTPFDFIRQQEETEEDAVKILCELSDLKKYDDPLKEVKDILDEEELPRIDSQIEVVNHLLAITLRDFLSTKINRDDYIDLEKQVNQWFQKIDGILTLEHSELSDIQNIQREITEFIKSHK